MMRTAAPSPSALTPWPFSWFSATDAVYDDDEEDEEELAS
jgi:hypothetical protein